MLKERTRGKFTLIQDNYSNGNLEDAVCMVDMLNRDELALFCLEVEGPIKEWLGRIHAG